MKAFLRLTVLATMLTSSLTLNAASKPNACPSIESLKNTSLSYAREFDNHMWLAFQERQKYDTQEEWGFGIGMLDVENEKDALMQAQNALPSLSNPIGPSYEGYDVWSCVYSLDNGLYAKAITPPIDVKRYLK